MYKETLKFNFEKQSAIVSEEHHQQEKKQHKEQ
jgi:hypothetical protein